MGTIAGSMLPIVLKKFGADPATSSAPFVATLVDVTGLVIYFSVAFMIHARHFAVKPGAASPLLLVASRTAPAQDFCPNFVPRSACS